MVWNLTGDYIGHHAGSANQIARTLPFGRATAIRCWMITAYSAQSIWEIAFVKICLERIEPSDQARKNMRISWGRYMEVHGPVELGF